MIKCDYCEKQLEPKKLKIRRGKIKDIHYNYFTCPHCGVKFPTVIRNKELDEKLIILCQLLSVDGPAQQIEPLKAEVNQIRNELSKELHNIINRKILNK